MVAPAESGGAEIHIKGYATYGRLLKSIKLKILPMRK